ncbi:MAG: YbhB/YbcL family Raf kinase inhibitor-like protein [Polyangiaceae bacterium]
MNIEIARSLRPSRSCCAPLFLAAAIFAACSSETTGSSSGSSATDAGTTLDSATGGDAAADVAKPAFALGSKTIVDGETMPSEYTCDGADTHPDLAWTEGPEGTKSYAIVFNDTTLKFLHSSVFDIPKDVFVLPLGLEKKAEPSVPAGAKQSKNYKGANGYTGPCPPNGEDLYEFVLYALDVDKLAEVTTASTVKQVDAAVKAHSLGSVRLTAKYKKK